MPDTAGLVMSKAPQPHDTSSFSDMKRLARIACGYSLIGAGTVMIFIPGPGLVTIVGGLALLQDDVEWAGRAANWLKQKTGRPEPREDSDPTVGPTN